MVYQIQRFPKLTSTNDQALKYFRELSSGTLIVAAEQTAGRGQRGKSWASPAGNLYASLVLKGQRYSPEPIALHMGQLLKDYLEEKYQLPGVSVKLPNDVLVDGHKIAGILVESYIQGDQVQGVIIGLGININMSEELLADIDQPATTLALKKNRDIDLEDFLYGLIIRMQSIWPE